MDPVEGGLLEGGLVDPVEGRWWRMDGGGWTGGG